MKSSDLIQVLADAIKAGEQICVKGSPGIGKTDVWKQAASVAGADLLIKHPAVEEPTDPKGLPAKHADGTHAIWLPYGDMYRAMQQPKGRRLLILLDDLAQASEATLKGYMQLLHGRTLGEFRLPEEVTFGAATNDVRQMSGTNMGLIEPVKSRFTSIVSFDVSVDDWCAWALDAGLPAILVAFMRSPESTLPEGHLLNLFKPTKELTNSPCPRTWAAVARLLPAVAAAHRFELFAGAVGAAAAQQFINFITIAEKAPSLDSILTNPDSAVIPDAPSLRFLVCTALARKATPVNFDRILRYLYRLPQPFRLLSVTDATRFTPGQPPARKTTVDQLIVTEAYQRWSLKEGTALTSGSQN